MVDADRRQGGRRRRLGNTAAVVNDLASLYSSEKTRLTNLIRRIVADSAAVEDVIQDTFLGLARLWPSLRIADPRPYLTVSARNAAVEHLRRERSRRRHLEAPLEPELQACPAPLPDAVLAARQEYAALQAAVARLPERCRVVFLLYREHGLTMRAIAERLDLSEKTVEKHIARAMVDLRAALRTAGRWQ